MLINAGVTEIVYFGDYPDELALEITKEADLKVRQYVE
jgi:deoxycytidylate deaminase